VSTSRAIACEGIEHLLQLCRTLGENWTWNKASKSCGLLLMVG
jgi:hypothetical protein